MEKKMRKLSTIVCLAIFFLGLTATTANAAALTPEEYINNGEDALFSETVDGILQAHSIFQEAKTTYPDDPVINAYLALTLLLDLALTEDEGGLADLLAQFGVSRTGDDLETLQFNAPLNKDEILILPETAPSGEAIRSFLAGPLLAALNNSISNLDTTINIWSDPDKHIIPGEKIESDKDIEFDYGDIFLLRAGLKAMKTLVLIISAYDLDVSIREIAALANVGLFDLKDFFDRYPDFLNLLTTSSTPSVDGANQLSEARTALLEAIDDYLTASENIRNDNDTELGAEELIEIDPFDYEEQLFRENLSELKGSFIENRAADLVLERVETEYHVYGAASFSTDEPDWWNKGYHPEQYGYDYLGTATATETFSGDYAYYIITTYPTNIAPVDTVQGSDESYFGTGITGNTPGYSNVGGPPDGNCALVGGESDGFSGGFIVIDPQAVINSLTVYIDSQAAMGTQYEEHLSLNLNPLFNNTPNLRDFLPQFNECNTEVAGTMGHGLGDDPTLGGIFPDFTQDDWDLESEPCGPVDIPVVQNDGITVDGSLDDWTALGIASVYTDVAGNDDPDLDGTDIKALYLARDENYLYLAMTLYDGPPSEDVMYWFVAAKRCDEADTLGERSTGAVYSSGDVWVSAAISRGDWQTIGSHPGDAAPGSNAIEWKVPLGEMGNLPGKFIRLYTHAYGPYEPSEDHFTCLQIGPLPPVTGTLNVPAHDGEGAIYIGVFLYEGSYEPTGENFIGGAVIYPGEYSDGMTYTVTNVPVDEEVFVGVWWDSDLDGVQNPGDYGGATDPFIIGSGGATVDIIADEELAPFSIVGSVMNVHQPNGSFSTYLDISIGDFTGILPDDIASITVRAPSGVLPLTKADFTYSPQWRSFFIAIPGSPEIGDYTFTVVSGTSSSTATDTQSINRTIPVPDTSTFSPAEGEMLTSKTPSFAWDPLDYLETTIYYRFEISDLSGWRVFATRREQGLLSCTLPLGVLNPGQTYRWRVRATDSSDFWKVQNRSHSEWLTFTMDSTLTHSATPAIDLNNSQGTMTWSTTSGTNLACSVKVIDHDGVSSDGSSHSMTVTFPDGTTYPVGFDSAQSATSAYYWLYVNLEGSLPQPGAYTFTVTDPDENVGTDIDTLVVNPLDPPDQSSFTPTMDSVTANTTPTFTWYPVTGANRHRVRIYSSDNSQTIWNGYVGGNQTTYSVPPGILYPTSSYRYRIEAWDSHNPLDVDNRSKSPDSNNDNYRFYTGEEESVDPFIEFDSSGVQTWSNDLVGACLSFWIKIHDAQGVPGDIKSVKVVYPSGIEEVLYYDVGDSNNTSTSGIYRSDSFLSIESGTYTFTVEDREGHIYSVHEDLTPDPIGYPAETSLRPLHNTVINGTAVDFDWEDVSGAAFYRVEIYDKDYNRIYTLATTESQYELPAGFLQEETLYRYRITTRREFFDQNVDNGSSSPWSFNVMPTIITTPVTGGSFNPSIDLEHWGAYTLHILKPGSGDSSYWLVFEVKVTDQDGVPANIESMRVTYPDGTTTRDLQYDEEISPTEARYFDLELYDNPNDIQPGTYTFTVTDFDRNSSVAASDDLVVDVLEVPTNCTPPQDSTVAGTTPTIAWDDVSGAAGYRVRIYDGWNGTIHWSDYLAESTYTVPAGILEPGKMYSYRISAYREAATDEDVDNMSIDQLYASERKHFTTTTPPDTDEDGMPDDWETSYGLNPSDDSDASGDLDEDGLSNLAEYQNNTNPNNSDTDEDEMPDGWEVTYGLNPLVDDASEDMDNDGYSNLQEYLSGTKPNDSDSKPVQKGDIDGDGNVDLADAILALQVLTGLNPEGFDLGADVDGDGEIGLAELIYILQTVAHLR